MKENYSKGRVILLLDGKEVNKINFNNNQMKELNKAIGEADRHEILYNNTYDILVERSNNITKIGLRVRV